MTSTRYVLTPPEHAPIEHYVQAAFAAIQVIAGRHLESLEGIPENLRYLFRECPSTATQPAHVPLAIQDDEATIDDLVNAMMTTPGTMRGFAIAILQHVRAGKVRGLTTTVEAQDALTTEFHAHQAEVQRLHVESSNHAAQAEEYRRERDRLAAEVATLKRIILGSTVLASEGSWPCVHTVKFGLLAQWRGVDGKLMPALPMDPATSLDRHLAAECGKEK